MSEIDQSYQAHNTSQNIKDTDIVDTTDKKVFWQEKMVVVSRDCKIQFLGNYN